MRAAKTDIRQELFAREYVIDLNGARAAIAAGYSPNGADVKASQLLGTDKVRARVDELLSKRATKLEIKAEKVLEEIQRLAFSNMQDYTRVDGDGRALLDLTAITRDQFAAVQEIREDTTGGSGDGERKVVVRTTLKLADKVKALDQLMRHLGQYNDKLDVNVKGELAGRLGKARQRAKR